MPAICPGQDTRFWRPDDIFDVTCGVCGKSVEFFKDDVTRRCRACGTLIRNPKITLGCAQWCEHAKACLGYDPKDIADGDAETGSLLDTIIEAVKRSLKGDGRVSRALAVVEEAEELLRHVEAERRVVLAAAALSTTEADDEHGTARSILEQVGLDSRTIGEVCDLIGGNADSLHLVEGRLLRDAVRLADVRAAAAGAQPMDGLAGDFETEVGRHRAEQLRGEADHAVNL